MLRHFPLLLCLAGAGGPGCPLGGAPLAAAAGGAGCPLGGAPTLVPAALNSVTPAGVVRGGSVTLRLDGVSLAGTTRAVFDDPAITGTPAPGGSRNQVRVTAAIGPEARTGIHRVFLITPLGATGSATFFVGAWPELPEREPNDSPGVGEPAALPVTFTGALTTTGDRDHFRFRVEAGQELVFEVVASQIRSRLQSVLTLLDSSGRVLAETQPGGLRADAVLVHRFREAGVYAIRIRDFESATGGDVNYRLNAGAFRCVTSAFPAGVGRQGGAVTLYGANLGSGETVEVPPAAGDTVTLRDVAGEPLLAPVQLAVGSEPEVMEAGAAGTPARAQAVEWPVTINGRLAADGETDHYRFRAGKGQQVTVEVQARRLGSPLDPVVEVLDHAGARIERATLRCVAETAMTLSDRDSAQSGLRLLNWNDLAIHDLIYVRGEIVQITLLPRGPDDDTRFRTVRGQRLGLLETTPSGHAVNTPVYKVQVHPPGRTFPPNGMPVFRLHYRNDDGGPLYGKDSRLTFTAPADGEYVVRLADVRGEGSERHVYRLTLREPRPDFRLSLTAEHLNVPAGARVPMEVTADRLDGFDGEITARLEGLPPGLEATEAVIEAGETTATLLVTAGEQARTGSAPVRLVGRAEIGGAPREHEAALGGGTCCVTVLPRSDLTVHTPTARITIAPGTEQYVEAAITREHGFAGRVPIEMRNLPFGVRVLDVGLNGVLIIEGETSRRFTLICEPWVKPMRRWVYCTVKTEAGSSAPTDVAAEPILLEVLPRSSGGKR